jgi:hypothetical protein
MLLPGHLFKTNLDDGLKKFRPHGKPGHGAGRHMGRPLQLQKKCTEPDFMSEQFVLNGSSI